MSDLFETTDEERDEFRALMQDPAARQAFVQIKARAAENGARAHYEHVLRAVGSTVWAIQPSMLALIVDLLAFRVEGGRFSSAEIEQRIGAARREPREEGPQGVAVIPIQGAIVPKAGLMSDVSGATSVDSLRQNFRAAMAAEAVSAVVLDIHSPGGMIDQIPEMAAEMRAARGVKPIVAVADALAASGAYWLAAQADEIVVTKSGRVGSIGVYTAHEDESAKQATEGIKTTLISAGKHKTDGNPFEPLTDEARGHMQDMVNNFYNMFISDVARGRGVSIQEVRGGFGEGRVVGSAEAVTLGMADRVGTLDDVLKSLLGHGRTSNVAASSHQHPLAVASNGYLLGNDPVATATETDPDETELADPAEDLSDEEQYMLDLSVRLGSLKVV